MTFTAEELKYIRHVMHCASSFTIARGREAVTPSVNHYKLMDKIRDYENRMRM